MEAEGVLRKQSERCRRHGVLESFTEAALLPSGCTRYIQVCVLNRPAAKVPRRSQRAHASPRGRRVHDRINVDAIMRKMTVTTDAYVQREEPSPPRSGKPARMAAALEALWACTSSSLPIEPQRSCASFEDVLCCASPI